MKIAVNKCFGGFSIKKEYRELYSGSLENIANRADKKLISLIETIEEDINDDCSLIKIITIPDNSTDWDIINNAGYEILIYVVDGLILYA